MGFWNDQHIQFMREQLASKATSTQVARLLGITRNMVISKARREGIPLPGGREYVRIRPQAGPRHRFIWNPRAIERLCELGAEKITSAEIAEKLSREFVGSISPSGVRAKAAVLGIPLRGRELQMKEWRQKGSVSQKPRKPAAPRIPVESIIPVGVTFANLERLSCRYPIGDPQDDGFTFCGLNNEGNTYCPGHRQLCYVPANRR